MDSPFFPFVQFKTKHPVSGRQISSRIETIAIRAGLVDEADTLVKPLAVGTRFLLVCDINTYAALGQRLEKVLGSIGTVTLLQLAEPVRADEDTVLRLREVAAQCDALIAAGSGTINDLCKYASFLDHKPYIVFASAASMNGYASANAAITVRGHKKSLPAHLPRALFFDLKVLVSTPNRLTRSGLGDSLCRSTAQTDWLLSHLLLGTPYDETPFVLLRPYETELFDHCAELMKGNTEILTLLIKTLVLSGLGMVIAGGSYPASQGEHLIAHTMEMVYGDIIPATYHGEQIAVTTLTMAHLQEQMMKQSLKLAYRPVDEASILQCFGQETGLEVLKEFRRKSLGPVKIKRMNEKLQAEWHQIIDKLHNVAVPFARLQKVMRDVRGPTHIEQLGWSVEQYKTAARNAHFMRNRFTFLDLAYYRE